MCVPDLLPLKNVKMKNLQRKVWYICIVCKNKGSVQPGWHGTHCHWDTGESQTCHPCVSPWRAACTLLTAENAHWSHLPGRCEVPGSILILETKLLLAIHCLENFQTRFPNHFYLFPLLSVGREESELVEIINACRMIS